MRDAYLNVLELGYYEVGFAFEGLADENVWKRPATGLLSVGELAGHMAYGEAIHLAGECGDDGYPDLTKCRVSSLLIDHRFAYLPRTLDALPSEEHRALSGAQVLAELLRVHAESVADFTARDLDLNLPVPGWSPEWTGKNVLQYMAFHVAYHTGQMFTARHLLGELTPDN